MADERDVDFLDEFIAESTDLNPEFPELMEAVGRRRELVSALRDKRREAGLSQAKVAASMETSQSAVARLETIDYGPNLTTLEKYAYSVGCRIEFSLEPIPEPTATESETSKAR